MLGKYKKNGYNFLLRRMYFTGNDGYQNFLVFAPILSSLILDSKRIVTNWIQTKISFGKMKPFDTNFEWIMSNLGR